MRKLFENTGEGASAKDGGFVFQAVISHSIKWEIINGEAKIDPKKMFGTLHQVDLFPDMKFNGGDATLTYVILSEVNLLKRKFDLASEAIKKRIKPDYAEAIKPLDSEASTLKRNELNAQYFANTYYEVELSTNRIVLREVSTSGIDSGSAQVTLKVSTGLVDTLDGKPIKSWDNFQIKVDGSSRLVITNQVEPISSIKEYDQVEKIEDPIFRTIVPSLVLDFKGERVAIDRYTQRSADVAAYAMVDLDKLFVIEDESKNKTRSV
jgi:hypothetical protein